MYVCLYAGLVTRLIHLEMIQDMSDRRIFLLGLRRFIARYNKPKAIIFNKADQFKLSSESIKQI